MRFLWIVLETGFWLMMFFGALVFVGWCALCLLFAAVNRTTDRYRRMNPSRNWRVGGSINPDL